MTEYRNGSGCLVRYIKHPLEFDHNARNPSIGEILECYLHRKLKLAGVLRARDATENGSERHPVGNVEIGAIKEVVSLGAKLQANRFGQSYVLLKGEVKLLQSRPEDAISGRAA